MTALVDLLTGYSSPGCADPGEAAMVLATWAGVRINMVMLTAPSHTTHTGEPMPAGRGPGIAAPVIHGKIENAAAKTTRKAIA